MAALALAVRLGGGKVASETGPAPVQRAHLVILHVNDTHGRLDPQVVDGRSVGGIARLGSLVKQVRRENPGRVLLVHAGDELSRGDKVSRYYRGRANIELMNLLGFDAMVLGNGDYYFGLETLRQRMAEAEFTILAGNILDASDGQRRAMGEEYLIKEVGPLRVGVMGLSLIRPEHPSCKDLRTGANLKLAEQWAAKLGEQTDVVVLLSHLGVTEDGWLAGMLRGVPVVVGGHTHTALKEPIVVEKTAGAGRKVYIVQAGEYYKYLGRVDLDFEREVDGGWRLVNVSSRLIELDTGIEPDAEIADLLEEYKQKMSKTERSSALPEPVGAGLGP